MSNHPCLHGVADCNCAQVPLRPPSVVVTGGCGMIGSRVVERIPGAVVYDVAKNLAADVERMGPYHDVIHDAKPIEGIIHLAGVSRLSDGYNDPVECVGANIAGTLNVLETARALDAWVVLGSTREITAGRRPQSMYEVSKHAAELLGERYAHDYACRVISLRFSDVYGADPADSPRMLPTMIRGARSDLQRVFASKSPHVYCPTHIEDTVEAILAGVEWIKYMPAGAYAAVTICGPDILTPRKLASLIKVMTGGGVEVAIEDVDAGPTDWARSLDAPSNRLAKQLLGWAPERSFSAWLERELAWPTRELYS